MVLLGSSGADVTACLYTGVEELCMQLLQQSGQGGH